MNRTLATRLSLPVLIVRRIVAAGLSVLAIGVGVALMLSGLLTSEAVQNPSISLDMVPAGNSYSDPGAGGNNSMAVGAIDGCLATTPPGNNIQHIHVAHLIVQNVENLIAWQARFNYIGDQMRISTWNGAPFTDTSTTSQVGFLNLPIDPAFGDHRGVSPAQNIPPPAPGPQTALIGLTRFGSDDFAISPDTPYINDEPVQSYDAPNGGILATLALQVQENNAGQLMLMDLDDNNPTGIGSSVYVFTGSGTQEIMLPPSALGDGSHDEGAGSCAPGPCPPPTTPTPTTFTTTDTFTNQTGQSASDLHARYDGPIGVCLVGDPDLCPPPSINVNNNNPPGTGQFDLDWGVDCVEHGQGATLQITSEPPATRLCSEWTRFGSAIGPGVPGDAMCTATATPTPTPTPSPTRPPGFHDAAIVRLRTVHNVRLAPGVADSGNAVVVAQNQGDHTDPVGVYLAFNPPGGFGTNPGGCFVSVPTGSAAENAAQVYNWTSVVLSLPSVLLDPGQKITLNGNVQFTCTNPAAVDGDNWQVLAIADVHGDDFALCDTPAEAFGGCSSAINDGDNQDANNTNLRPLPKVVSLGGATVMPTPTSSPTPSPTTTPGPTQFDIISSFTLTNSTAQAASDLHLIVTTAGELVEAQVFSNAPGCAQPSISFGRSEGPDFTYAADVIWSAACVDVGESVQFGVRGSNQGFLHCSNWTIFGASIGPECTPPLCGGVPCCNGQPCPTATPASFSYPDPAAILRTAASSSVVSRAAVLRPAAFVFGLS